MKSYKVSQDQLRNVHLQFLLSHSENLSQSGFCLHKYDAAIQTDLK